jgi:hypothetical protein
MRIQLTAFLVVLVLASIPAYFVLTSKDYSLIGESRQGRKPSPAPITERPTSEAVREVPPAVNDVERPRLEQPNEIVQEPPQELPKPPIRQPIDLPVLRDPPKPPAQPPVLDLPPLPPRIPETRSPPKLIVLSLKSLNVSDPGQMVFDGKRYIYINSLCNIVRIDTFIVQPNVKQLVEVLQPNNPEFRASIRVLKTGLDCTYDPFGGVGIALDNDHIWISGSFGIPHVGRKPFIAKFGLSSERILAKYDFQVPQHDVGGMSVLRIGADGMVYLATGTIYIAQLSPSTGEVRFIYTNPYLVSDIHPDQKFIYFTGERVPGVARINKDGTGLVIFPHSLLQPNPNADTSTSHLIRDASGRIWFTSSFKGVIGSLDPSSGKVVVFYNFTRAGSSDNGTRITFWQGADGPRGLAFDSNGMLWASGASTIAQFDQNMRLTQAFQIKGRVWFIVRGQGNTIWSAVIN